MKKYILKLLFIVCISLSAKSQKVFNVDDYTPVWDGASLHNSISLMFPFENKSTFYDVAIFFEKKENSNNIILRYRAFSYYSMSALYMKDTPNMLVKLGDGTILNSKKERVKDGILNAQFVFDVYFNLDNAMQQKIIKYGIEKVRIAYIYSGYGLNDNQIWDAYTKDSEMTGLNAQKLLLQIKNADFAKAKKEAKKNTLEYGF